MTIQSHRPKRTRGSHMTPFSITDEPRCAATKLAHMLFAICQGRCTLVRTAICNWQRTYHGNDRRHDNTGPALGSGIEDRLTDVCGLGT